MKYRLILIYLFNLFDLTMTWHWVQKFGIEYEINPIGKWILAEDYRIVLFKIILPIITLTLLYIFRQSKVIDIAAWVLFGFYGLLTIYNSINSILLSFM